MKTDGSGPLKPREGSARETRLESLVAAFLVTHGFDEATILEMSECGCISCRIIVTMYIEVRSIIDDGMETRH